MITRFLLSACALVLALGSPSANANGKCLKTSVLIAEKQNGDAVGIEASGLTYSPQLKRFIGVTDTGNELAPNFSSNISSAADWLIFGFEGPKFEGGCIELDSNGNAAKIKADELFSNDEYSVPFPYDLEGITTDGQGNYFAIGSSSRDSSDSFRDSANRNQFFKFKIAPANGNQNAQVNDFRRFERLGAKGGHGYDFRDWLLYHTVDWPEMAVLGKSETEAGLNIEAIAFRKIAIGPEEKTEEIGQIVIGLRGPLKTEGGFTQTANESGFAFTLVFDEFEPSEPPKYSHMESFDIAKWNQNNNPGGTFGIRALDFIDFSKFENDPIELKGYAVILGETNREHTSLVAGFIPLTQTIEDGDALSREFHPGKLLCESKLYFDELKEAKTRGNFVGEGIAAIPSPAVNKGDNQRWIDVVLVDDAASRVTKYTWKLDVSNPNNPKCKI